MNNFYPQTIFIQCFNILINTLYNEIKILTLFFLINNLMSLFKFNVAYQCNLNLYKNGLRDDLPKTPERE